MKKLLICLTTTGFILLTAACGTTEPEYLSTPALEPDIAYTPAEAPEPPSSLPTQPTPTPPSLPGPLQGEEEELVCQIPVPPQPLALPIVQHTISAGRGVSTAITDDGTLWMWGMYHGVTRRAFAEWVLQAYNEGIVSIYNYYDVQQGLMSNVLTPLDEGVPFTPGGDIRYLGGISTYLSAYGRPNDWYRISDLTIISESGNEINFPHFAEIHSEEQAWRLSPWQVAENAVSARANLLWPGSASMINEYGKLVFFGGGDQYHDQWFRPENIYIENVVDYAAFTHLFSHPTGRYMNFHFGLLFYDGSFQMLTQSGSTLNFFDANLISIALDFSQTFLLAYDGQLLVLPGLTAVETHEAEVIMDNVAQIATSDNHRLALTNDGRVYAWGRNVNGQVGDGSRQNRDYPTFIIDNMVAISAGDEHSMAIDANGVLWGWGLNIQGQVGYGGALQHFTPVQVMEDVVAVSAGLDHTLALTSDGTLWAFGNNEQGQLGDGTLEARRAPVPIKTGVRLP